MAGRRQDLLLAESGGESTVLHSDNIDIQVAPRSSIGAVYTEPVGLLHGESASKHSAAQYLHIRHTNKQRPERTAHNSVVLERPRPPLVEPASGKGWLLSSIQQQSLQVCSVDPSVHQPDKSRRWRSQVVNLFSKWSCTSCLRPLIPTNHWQP